MVVRKGGIEFHVERGNIYLRRQYYVAEIYKLLKGYWFEDSALIAHPFPLMNTSALVGIMEIINGWRFFDKDGVELSTKEMTEAYKNGKLV